MLILMYQIIIFIKRDACWWFIKSIGDYIEITKDNILKSEVEMIFHSDIKEEHFNIKSWNNKRTMKLYDIV